MMSLGRNERVEKWDAGRWDWMEIGWGIKARKKGRTLPQIT